MIFMIFMTMALPSEGFEYILNTRDNWTTRKKQEETRRNKKKINMSKKQNVWKNALNPQTLKPHYLLYFCLFVLNDSNGLSTWILQSLFEQI